MNFAHLTLVLPLLVIAGCTQFPELEGTVRPEVETAAYPELLPLGPILAHANSISVDPLREEAGLNGRLASLRARADNLRGSVLTGAEKQRLERGLR
jgi:hypothetical protein